MAQDAAPDVVGPLAAEVRPTENRVPAHDPWHPTRIRGIFALCSLGLLLVVIIMVYVQVVRGYLETREFIEIVLPVVASLVTGAAGFYLGSQQTEQ